MKNYLVAIISVLLLLAACHDPQTAAPVETPAVEPTPPETNVVPQDQYSLPEQTETHACALLAKEDGAKLCGMEFEASEFVDVQVHDTKAVCRQYFMSTKQPYPKVMVDQTVYYTPENATKMFGRDKLTKHGEDWTRNESFVSLDRGREIVFVIGDSRVEVNDPQGACFDLDALAEKAHDSLSARK